ncbi:hypothetical protein BGW42_000611 [Actinomortierella wolfii]|nr:hypothetical protein BGW42_000611 [Actinomortierella wolfii]
MSLLSKEWADTIIELPTLTFHTNWVPLSIFSALHGIRVAMAYRQAIEAAAEQSRLNGDEDPKPYRVPWGQGLLSVLAMSLGGGFTTSMLLGMPPSWLGSNVVVPTYTLSFFLIQYTVLYDILRTAIPATLLDSVLLFADASLRGLSISKLGVDGSRMRFAADKHSPGGPAEPWFAMLFLGTISGCGGGLWADVLKLKTHNWTWSTPSWVHAATWDMKAALTTAFFYATSTSPQVYNLLYGADTPSVHGSGGLLDQSEARAVTMLLLSSLLVGQRCEQTLAAKGYSLVAAPKRWLGSLAGVVANRAQDLKTTTTESSTGMTTRGRRKKYDDDENDEDIEEHELEEELSKIERDQAAKEEDEEEDRYLATKRALPRRRGRPPKAQTMELVGDDEQQNRQGADEDEEGEDEYTPTRRGTSSTRGRKRGGKTATEEPSRTSSRRRKPTRQEL